MEDGEHILKLMLWEYFLNSNKMQVTGVKVQALCFMNGAAWEARSNSL